MKKTLKNLQQYGRESLNHLDKPRLESDILLSHALSVSREKLWTCPQDEEILPEKSREFFEFIEKRKKYMPIAQIRGYKIWKNLEIIVDKHVLIPRDETEILVDYIVADIKKIKSPYESSPATERSRCLGRWESEKKLTILDVGCGSGCISIFMKKKFPEGEVMGLDISEEALKMSQKNAVKILGENLPAFQKSNLLEKIPENSEIDIIIANLPYVPEDLDVAPDLHHEPALAIFAKEDGLDLIKKLKQQIQEKNIKFQALWLEFLPVQTEKIQNIFSEYTVKFFTDEGGEIFFAKISS